MAKSKKLQRNSAPQQHAVGLPKLSSRCAKVFGDSHDMKRLVKASEKKEWEDAVCAVCMDFPHNAVLLLCSSYEKGCRAYMCATSHRYSNCLEQYRKAYTKVTLTKSTESSLQSIDGAEFPEGSGLHCGKKETSELQCPLCRGPVKGWSVVEPARRYLNKKKRICMQDKCSFDGTYKELRKHVKSEHPLSRPRDVDPSQVEKWKELENERDLSDVFSTIRSTMPGAIVIGDYVIERRGYHNFSPDYTEDDYLEDSRFGFPAYGRRWNRPQFSRVNLDEDYESLDDVDFDGRRVRTSASRTIGSHISRIGRPRARFLVGRRAERLRTGS
ncbi:hypothetical protein F511_03317 [Dorcoceras hygrometricum]|uniref:Uncharacterized protein n=1 Tax=Dorcoceras hygrometricum TaxID=472368 RepID=A0A2Z7BM77_9LAMI|nr:hypothetical protein F511_03317 [Dorcoceras hygrometricum]